MTKHVARLAILAAAALWVGCAKPNQPPTASFGIDPAGGEAPLVVAFDASAAKDADGSLAGYAWEFGTGEKGTGATAQYTYPAAGSYTVILTVTDDQGATGTSAQTVVVVEPRPAAEAPAAPAGEQKQ